MREGNELYKKNYTEATVSTKKHLKKCAYKRPTTIWEMPFIKKKITKKPSLDELTVKTAKDKTEKAEAFHNMRMLIWKAKTIRGCRCL